MTDVAVDNESPDQEVYFPIRTNPSLQHQQIDFLGDNNASPNQLYPVPNSTSPLSLSNLGLTSPESSTKTTSLSNRNRSRKYNNNKALTKKSSSSPPPASLKTKKSGKKTKSTNAK